MPPIAAEHRLERLLALPERDDVHRHVAERELAGRGQHRHGARTAP